MKKRLLAFLHRLLTIQSTDADTQRRGRLLGILLLSSLALAFLLPATNLVEHLSYSALDHTSWILFDAAVTLLIISLLRLNWAGHTRLAGSSFLIFYVVGCTVGLRAATLDRILLVYAVPTLASSFIVSPGSSFIFALLSGGGYTLAYLAGARSPNYNYISIIGLALMATVAWLAATHLEDALGEARRSLARERAAQKQAARLTENLQRRTQELAALNAASRAMTSMLNPQVVLKQVMDEVRRMVGAEGASVLLRDPTSDDMIFAAAAGPGAEGLVGLRVPITMGIAGWVVRERQSALVGDAPGDSRFSSSTDTITGLTTRSVLAVPLKFKGAVWGVIEAINQASGVFDEHDQEMLEALAGSAAIAIENAQLYASQEQRVAERTAQLKAANQELEAFAYSVSHDLRAPLRSIDGFSQALLQDYAGCLDDQGQHYLQRIRAATLQMSQLIDDLLKLSRVTRSEMRREPVDLSALAQAIAAELQAAQPERQIEWSIAPGLVVNADANLMRILLNNLMGNAWKFTARHPTARIELGIIRQDGEPVYFVRDDGAGFDMAYVDKLFGAFQRLHSVNEFEGTGIGLATVQRIAHRHGGRVWAEGAVEQGAAIYFTLL